MRHKCSERVGRALARDVLVGLGAPSQRNTMSLPRQILAGRPYMITRRCVQRQFLLLPDPITNSIFLYCLAEAAQRFGIDVILPSVLSNHHHTIVFDREGRVVEFMEHLHKMLARVLNARWGRSENLWSSAQVSLEPLEERNDVLEALVYAATNPVKDGLVDQIHHWPGVNGLGALLSGEAVTVTRPRYFFGEGGKMPREVTLKLVIPEELGDTESFRSELRQRVDQRVEEIRAARLAQGKRVLGVRAVKAQSWRDHARSVEPRGGIRPAGTARVTSPRDEALARKRAFVAAYRVARKAWLEGKDAVFPPGTYWLRRFASVNVAPSS